jgi:uncharacterized membrane protein
VAEPVRAIQFPLGAGLLFGLGLGGFFDGIVLHQVLQWHHMLSSWYPADTIDNIRLNTLWDGIFHAATYVFVVLALFLFWRAARLPHVRWSTPRFAGAVIAGWGAFNFVEGVIDHQVLGVHHVNELAPREHWLAWDLGFLAWGLAMIAAGAWLIGRARPRAPVP